MSKNVLKYLNIRNQFYKTPKDLIYDILYEIRHKHLFNDVEEIRFLEPCAGDGAICELIKEEFENKVIIDAIEIENVLRENLKGKGFNVVGEDFESYESIPFYNLIIMNPPFNKGDKFLLKAYEHLTNNGVLVCILNAETIKNPYTKDREILKNLIDKCGYTKFLENSFSEAERETNVEIAIVFLKKPNYETEFDFFGNINPKVLSDEEKIIFQLKQQTESGEIMTFNKVDNAIALYRNCVKQIFEGINTINQIKTGLSYLDKEAKEFDIKIDDFLKVILENNAEDAREESIKIIRKLGWSYVIKFCNMDKYLFHRQKNDFYNKIDKGSVALPFTKDNISQFFSNIFNSRDQYFKQGIVDLFEEITGKHSGNRFGEGWKTNKNWKIGKKIIVDWGIRFDYNSFSTLYGDSMQWLDDLDKVVRLIKNYEGSYTIKESLNNRFRVIGRIEKGQKFYNETETAYFCIKFYKKGSLHITFKDDYILEQLNVIGAKTRKDLGYDDYGK